MRCEFCQGSGVASSGRNKECTTNYPCPECNGTGIADCCNGITKEAGCVDHEEWPDNPAEVETFR